MCSRFLALAFAAGAVCGSAQADTAANGAPSAVSAPASAPVTGPVSPDAFFEKPDIASPELSPSGRYMASVRKHGVGQAVVIQDLRTGDSKIITYAATDKTGVSWIKWKGDDRLLLRLWLFNPVREGKKPDSPIIAVHYGSWIELVDRDGKNPAVIFQHNGGTLNSSSNRVALLSMRSTDPRHVLVTAPNAYGVLCAWNVDVQTGVAALLAAGDTDTIDWAADSAGAVVERTEVKENAIAFQARNGDAWNEVFRIRRRDIKELPDFDLLGAADKPGQIYVATRPTSAADGDTRALRTYDFTTKTLSAPIWPQLKYDFSSIVYDDNSNKLLGVCYVADVKTCDFKDEMLQKRFAAIASHFGGKRSVSVVSMSDDDQLWVLAASGPEQPTAYYLYDTAKNVMSPIGDSRADLSPGRLGKMDIVKVKTRDGAEITAYLTRPPQAGKGPLPLVVLPHGGPEARDLYDYDDLTQFIATRGYLVLQPNFRGSGGYGRAFAEAGYHQWGKRMQDDVLDAIQQLVGDGTADPARVCIVGASYGGYAALEAGATHPELFKCVASLSGVSDLPAMLKWEKRTDGADDPAYRYWVKSIGDPKGDADALKQDSPVTHVADYRQPVLLVHGDADETVPIAQSREMEKALKSAGKPVRFVVLKNQGHGDFDEDQGKVLFKELGDFLAANLGSDKP